MSLDNKTDDTLLSAARLRSNAPDINGEGLDLVSMRAVNDSYTKQRKSDIGPSDIVKS